MTFRYDRQLVERLLPTIWDESARIYGIPSEQAEEGMPKAQVNVAETGDHMAHCADLSKAWECAPLTLQQKRVLYLCFGLAWTQEGAAYNLRVDRSTISRHATAGISHLVKYLNGKEF